jgi:hypothetical protein
MGRSAQILFLFCTLLFMTATPAKQFANSYCSFWVPEDWECKLEETEYICRPSGDSIESKEVLLILTAKFEGPQDSLMQYRDYLERDRDGDGPARVLKPPRIIQLGERQWIDATHEGSEIPNYLTRYLATVEESVAILFTASIYRASIDKYSDIIEQIAVSVRARKFPANR